MIFYYPDLSACDSEQVQAWVDAIDNEGPEEIRSIPTSNNKVGQQILCDTQCAISRLIGKAPQLIGMTNKFTHAWQCNLLGNFTTNLGESWMHIRSKFDGRKQVNRSQAGFWQGQCAGADLRCNEGAGWGPTTWQKAVHTEPSSVFKLAAADMIKCTNKDHKHKATAAAKLQRKNHDIVQLR